MEKENKKSIQEKISTIKYICDSKTHLVLDEEKCKKCDNKICTFICPADVYNYDSESDKIVVQYENCLECGACRIACPKKAIDWEFPKSGCGIILKNS